MSLPVEKLAVTSGWIQPIVLFDSAGVVAGEVLGELIVDEGQARARLTLSVCSEHKEILGPNPHVHFIFSDGMQVSL